MKIGSRYINSALSLVGGAIAGSVLIAACGAGSPQLDDLKNTPPVYPNYAVTVISPDNFPNYVMSCYRGVGFALTSRDAAGAITRVPEWDQFCSQQNGKQATQNGQP